MGCQLRCCPPKLALCQLPALWLIREEKSSRGWKQGHTPAEFSEPLPLAGVLFCLLLLKDCLVAGEVWLSGLCLINVPCVIQTHDRLLKK